MSPPDGSLIGDVANRSAAGSSARSDRLAGMWNRMWRN